MLDHLLFQIISVTSATLPVMYINVSFAQIAPLDVSDTNLSSVFWSFENTYSERGFSLAKKYMN